MTAQTLEGNATRPTQMSETVAEPELKRTMGLRSVVLFGLAYMTPIIALGTFGVIAAASHGAAPTEIGRAHV